MKKLLILTLLFPIFSFFGCASTSEHQKLKAEFEHLRTFSEQQYSTLNKEMAIFKAAYNPKLQEQFSENLLAAEEYRELIGKIKNDIEDISDRINRLLQESENDRMLISENLRTSTVQNIVNEFSQLNYYWASTVSELSNLVADSEDAAKSSHRAAMKAAEKAGAAESSAVYAVDSLNQLNKQAKSLGMIQEKVKNLESEIRKLNKQINREDEPKRKKQ